MLYDPKWDQQTKADPFKIETLIAWLEKQPAETEYCYFSNGKCLLAQYFQAHGFPLSEMRGDDLVTTDGQRITVPFSWDVLAQGQVYIESRDEFLPGVSSERTFGAALERARKLAA